MRRKTPIIDRISELLAKGTAFLVGVVALLVTIEVVLRYLFNSPTLWSSELVVYICSATYLLSGAYVHLLGKHVSIDAIYLKLKVRGKAIIDLISDIFLLIFSGTLTLSGAGWMWEALISRRTSGTIWNPPLFPVRFLIVVGAFILFLQGLSRCVRTLIFLFRREQLEERR